MNETMGNRITKYRKAKPMTLVKLAMEVGADVVPNMSGDVGNMIKDLDMIRSLKWWRRGWSERLWKWSHLEATMF